MQHPQARARVAQEEIRAIEASLPAVGEVVAEIGADKPVSAYSKDEALRLIFACVRAYQAQMCTITEAEGPPF